MPIANNLLTSAILAPLITILSGVSLATLQRSLEWISTISKTPQKGYLRQMKPFIKNIDTVLDRVFAGNKFAVNAQNILLMGILICLICLLLEGGEKPPKRVIVVDNKKKN